MHHLDHTDPRTRSAVRWEQRARSWHRSALNLNEMLAIVRREIGRSRGLPGVWKNVVPSCQTLGLLGAGSYTTSTLKPPATISRSKKGCAASGKKSLRSGWAKKDTFIPGPETHTCKMIQILWKIRDIEKHYIVQRTYAVTTETNGIQVFAIICIVNIILLKARADEKETQVFLKS